MKIKESVNLPVSPKPQPWDIDCSKDPGLTKQEFADDCDVNKIIARCVRNGMPLPSTIAEPLYADVSEIGSYADCVRRVKAAEESFMELPPEIRTRFDNDPASLISFLADPANVSEARSIGLLAPAPKDPEVKAEPVPPVAVPAAVVK